MRRASMAIAAAVVGTAGLVGLKVQHDVPAHTHPVATAPHTPGAGAFGQPSRSHTSSANPTAGPITKSGTPESRTTTSHSPSAVRTFTGTREPAGGYGYVQVKIEMAGARLTDITMLEVTSEPNGAALQAPATLIQEALAARSADIANVSRATYTSEAFKASLRHALAQG
jgi:uncharacterized protein with FMN-binding domain